MIFLVFIGTHGLILYLYFCYTLYIHRFYQVRNASSCATKNHVVQIYAWINENVYPILSFSKKGKNFYFFIDIIK